MKTKELKKVLHEACEILEKCTGVEISIPGLPIPLARVELSDVEKRVFITTLASVESFVSEKDIPHDADLFVKVMIASYAMLTQELESKRKSKGDE